MYGVARAITRPQDVTEHRHLSIIKSIVQAIRDAPGPIHLWKVKSHSGIVGNELADYAAVQVAKGQTMHPQIYDTPSNDRSTMHWPYEETKGVNKEGGPTTIHTPLADLKDTLSGISHARRKYGSANKEGIYASSWLNIGPQVHHAVSHAFIRSTKVSPSEVKTALQYRWGLLPTVRWLHRIGQSTTTVCPLPGCREEDGGHHVASGCKVLSDAYTLRHNDAATEILEAIGKGTMGHCVLMADVGLNRRRAPTEHPDQLQHHRFMKHMAFPDHMCLVRGALRAYRGSVPDIFVAESTGRDCSSMSRYLLVEVKYCRDTDPGPQTERATAQHQELQDLLKENDPSCYVRVVPLVLGVSGVIYTTFLEEMENLGVSGPALKSLTRRLHILAVKHLGKIWRLRQALLGAKKGRPGKLGRKRHNVGNSGKGRKRQQGRTAVAMTASRPSLKRPSQGAEPEHRKRRRKR
jgi:hypothetical protein